MTATLARSAITESCLVFTGIGWEQFLDIENAFTAVEGIRFAYLDGALEIMPVSTEHEDVKSTIRLLLETYLRAKGMSLITLNLKSRSQTWRSQ